MVQQYLDAVIEPKNNIREANREIKKAREQLNKFCLESVKQLLTKGYEGGFYLGSIGSLALYEMRNGKIYNDRMGISNEIEPEQIPFSIYKGRDIIEIAKGIELIVQRYS